MSQLLPTVLPITLIEASRLLVVLRDIEQSSPPVVWQEAAEQAGKAGDGGGGGAEVDAEDSAGLAKPTAPAQPAVSVESSAQRKSLQQTLGKR